MFYTYAISSLTRNYIYIGLPSDIDRRLSEHNSGKNKTTKPYLPFVLIYSEMHETRSEAREREKYFKSGIGREKLRSIRDNRING
ncbi:GIY-YIG nuclease family protein [Flavobacterium sp.]|uniref:GIY-YIG nuclease family protein n=1 Tax=Flavobacterium sp. TaxID=239 RepID=UPI0026194B09|nr:GIY-YIG nuclease family protein [Flavobacterium sp.]